MTFCMNGAVAQLQGDLTHAGVTHGSIDSMAVNLEEMTAAGEKTLRIDCTRVYAADHSGLYLLYVWMQCARFRGVEPVLVNLSISLQKAIQHMGVEHCFADTNTG